MTFDEKINFLQHLEEIDILTSEHLNKVVQLSDDEDEFVRGQVAVALVYFDNKIAQETLLKLACDEDSLVRTEAYDSLAVYENVEVLRFLEKVIEIERDALACSYAIMSWTDIVIALDENLFERRTWIIQLMDIDKIYQSEHCLLSCYRAMFLLGEINIIYKIIALLESKDYLIRCSVIGVFEDIINNENADIIKEQLKELQRQEKTKAVNSRIDEFFINLNL